MREEVIAKTIYNKLFIVFGYRLLGKLSYLFVIKMVVGREVGGKSGGCTMVVRVVGGERGRKPCRFEVDSRVRI